MLKRALFISFYFFLINHKPHNINRTQPKSIIPIVLTLTLQIVLPVLLKPKVGNGLWTV